MIFGLFEIYKNKIFKIPATSTLKREKKKTIYILKTKI